MLWVNDSLETEVWAWWEIDTHSMRRATANLNIIACPRDHKTFVNCIHTHIQKGNSILRTLNNFWHQINNLEWLLDIFLRNFYLPMDGKLFRRVPWKAICGFRLYMFGYVLSIRQRELVIVFIHSWNLSARSLLMIFSIYSIHQKLTIIMKVYNITGKW